MFVCRDGAYSEGGEARTRQNVDDAERQGFDVVVFRVVYDDAPKAAR